MNINLIRKGFFFLVAVFLPAFLILRFFLSINQSSFHKNKNLNEENMIKQKIELMSLDQKIGQLMFLGGDFQEIKNDDWRLMAGGLLISSKFKVQSSKLLGEEIIKLEEKIASQSGIFPFIGIDQEGGEVCRLDWLDCASQKMVVNRHQAMILARNRGEELKKLGINLVFAPVLDVSDEKADFIWGRTFNTSDSAQAADLGLAMIGGFNQAGIISCPKHFPGHGGTKIDSHQKLPVIDCDNQCLDTRLYPFKMAINNGVKMIMIGHINIKLKAQSSKLKTTMSSEKNEEFPASISSFWITGLLRNQLNFDGVVITDDLMMGALSEVEYPDKDLDKSQLVGCSGGGPSGQSRSRYGDSF